MRVILSRKGFDSTNGAHPSPVLPSGEMVSLPIPTSMDTLDYDAICGPGSSDLGAIIGELDAGARLEGGAHLDPDLVRGARPRLPGWRPAFGQINGRSTHLLNEGLKEGDLFLFYGWFRHTEHDGGRLRFIGPRGGFHAIFGYMEVDEIIRADSPGAVPDWLHDHPHAIPSRLAKTNNLIFIATENLSFAQSMPGGSGLRFADSQVLTKRGMPRSRWNLDPALFQHVRISHHSEESWKDGYFESFPRAQEYVVHADEAIIGWAHQLLAEAGTWDAG